MPQSQVPAPVNKLALAQVRKPALAQVPPVQVPLAVLPALLVAAPVPQRQVSQAPVPVRKVLAAALRHNQVPQPPLMRTSPLKPSPATARF